MKATFQVVLKQPVYPQYFLARNLFDVVRAEAVVIGDYDFATVGEWIRVSYDTAYKSVVRRHLLGFTLEPPDEIDEQIARRIIEGDADDATLDSLGSLLQADAETVEAVLRYHDDGLLADINNRTYAVERQSSE